MNNFLYLFITLFLIACKPAYYKDGISQEQFKQDHIDCNFEASKVGGYDSVDKAINQNNTKKACLESKGYTRERRPNN